MALLNRQPYNNDASVSYTNPSNNNSNNNSSHHLNNSNNNIID